MSDLLSATTIAGTFTAARSIGLITKDTSSGTAQTATVRKGAVLSLYARTSTIAAMSATGGTFYGNRALDANQTYTSQGTYTLAIGAISESIA
jgi:hypothetical protein